MVQPLLPSDCRPFESHVQQQTFIQKRTVLKVLDNSGGEKGDVHTSLEGDEMGGRDYDSEVKFDDSHCSLVLVDEKGQPLGTSHRTSPI
ncbi:unnamed protein product [Dovyalis caffra]|uniref:Uncharacterized protein n=1 Tax=Dovyalis caffra TaxID=77055 RepID=A0AAV1SEH3_9ROSI|nr:unnamed protein product [Dovyalis caffra]